MEVLNKPVPLELREANLKLLAHGEMALAHEKQQTYLSIICCLSVVTISVIVYYYEIKIARERHKINYS